MKTVFVKKLSAVMLSAVMAAAMAVPTFVTVSAAELENGKITSSDTSLEIPKGVTVKNATDGNYYGPAVVYSYTIAPVAPVAGAKVKDASNNDFPVEQGVVGGAVLANNGQVSFTSEKANNVSDAGVEQTKNLVINVDLSKFTKPGVYRYEIKDVTTTATLYAAGINRPDNYDTDRFLDVYIKNGDTDLMVSGYTLTTDNAVDTSSDKDSGFTQQEEGTVTDTYRTYNIRLEKQVTGDMGDKTHEFPFTAVIENSGLTYFYGKDSNSVVTESNAASLETTLKNADVLYIRGLSPRAKVGYTETNDTGDTYKVTVEGRAATEGDWTSLVAEQAVAANGSAALSLGSITTYETVNNADSVKQEGALTNYRDVRYTNNLETVSPTGIVLRFAPFIIIAGIGVVLLVLTRRTRRKEESDVI